MLNDPEKPEPIATAPTAPAASNTAPVLEKQDEYSDFLNDGDKRTDEEFLDGKDKAETTAANTAPVATAPVAANTAPVVKSDVENKPTEAEIELRKSLGEDVEESKVATLETATPVATAAAIPTAAPADTTQEPAEAKTNGVQKVLESSIVRNLIGSEKSSKIASVVKAAESLKKIFTPAQERTSGDKLSEDSATFESNKMAAAIQPVVLNNMVQQGGGGCRFVPTPPAPMPPVDIKNADASIKSAFSRDRWA